MKFTPRQPSRVFRTGYGPFVDLSDCGQMQLEADEQITFITDGGAELDVVRKSWGYYGTPSLNSRLVSFGLRTALAKSRLNRYFVLIVEAGKEEEFFRYLETEDMPFIGWLDNEKALGAVEAALKKSNSNDQNDAAGL
ncbi:hypothetical protein ACHMW5_08480 (plasmid) [Azospirillum melinis]|uniref:hypothetical protein n=1 Tax=Azospirillum melinis TaxID=328839 RepID=UPI0037577F27